MDASNNSPRAANTLPGGRIEWLRADALQPWRLQRELNKAAAKKIARHFDPDLFQTLTVSRRDGVDYLLDGQHRWAALVDEMQQGATLVPCLVYTDLTDEQEAKFFHAQGPGVRRQLSNLHDFRVLYESGDPETVQIVATVERAGLRMSWSKSKANNTLNSTQALRQVSERFGFDRLHQVLTFLHDALGPDSRAYNGDMILGFNAFLERYADIYQRADMVTRVKQQGVDGMIREMQNQVAANGGGRASNMGRAFVKVYNKNKSSRRLSEWQENYMTPARAAAQTATRIKNFKKQSEVAA